MAKYSLDVLHFQFSTSPLFHVQFLLFLHLLLIGFSKAGKVVWYSHLFRSFPQFIMIYIVKGFSVVNEVEVDVFLEL